MRDYIFVTIVLPFLFLILSNPFVGIILYNWFSLMNPHRMTWGFAQEIRLALIISLLTFFSWLFTKEKKFFNNMAQYALILFLMMITFTCFFSLSPDKSWDMWTQYSKRIIFALITLSLLTNKIRIHVFIWVCVFSLGYYGVKGGLFTLATGGSYEVQGPPSSMIADRNHLALALIMVTPLINYLRLTSKHKYIQHGLLFTMGLTFIAIIGTYSRGGFIGLSCMTLILWWQSKNKFTFGSLIFIFLIVGIIFMPAKYTERLQTIKTAQTEDASFKGRLDAWSYAWRVALDRPFVGGGITSTENPSVFFKYVPEATTARAAHSIYFQILGDNGFPTLILYISMLFLIWRNSSQTIKICKDKKQLYWAKYLAQMTQVSLIGFCSAGAALSMAYYDMFFNLIIISISLKEICIQSIQENPTSKFIQYNNMPNVSRALP